MQRIPWTRKRTLRHQPPRRFGNGSHGAAKNGSGMRSVGKSGTGISRCSMAPRRPIWSSERGHWRTRQSSSRRVWMLTSRRDYGVKSPRHSRISATGYQRSWSGCAGDSTRLAVSRNRSRRRFPALSNSKSRWTRPSRGAIVSADSTRHSASRFAFSKQAEERIHRDLAPVLRRGVQQRLASVTGGRYTDCRVNPQTLAVEVCGDEGRWRSAVDLSQGTAEQIYLLLRVTLAEHSGNQTSRVR